MPVSSEFVALCRAQIALLTQGFGAALSVVYLTRQLTEGAEAHLVPIVAYPEATVDWTGQGRFLLPLLNTQTPASLPRLLNGANAPAVNSELLTDATPSSLTSDVTPGRSPSVESTSDLAALVPQRQMVLPLIHEEVVLGLLVVGRNDRGWSTWERSQIEQIAKTITHACVLDQRYQWLAHEHAHEQLLQAQQHDQLDNLLHQFRNSLTVLQTFGKLILKRLLPGDATRSIADSIVRETNRLKELSQQLEATMEMPQRTEPLLLPAAIELPDAGLSEPLPEAGPLSETAFPLVPCAIPDVLEPLLASAQTIAQAQNLTLHTNIPTNLPLVSTNPQALREALNNLIENALKYTPAGGHILVEAMLGPEWLEIAVSDTGPGIPPQDLPHIFERRYRGVQADSSIPGSGLGLAIAKTLVEQLHGQLALFSPANSPRLRSQVAPTPAPSGSGTTFVVKLPLKENPASLNRRAS